MQNVLGQDEHTQHASPCEMQGFVLVQFNASDGHSNQHTL